MVLLNRSNAQTECDPDMLGPFDFVQITYDRWCRVGPDNDGDRQIAEFSKTLGLWLFDDGTAWTDIVVTAA